MQYRFVYKIFSTLCISFILVSCGNDEPTAGSTAVSGQPEASKQQAERAEGVIAQVADQVITYNDLSIMLNSSAMVGLSIPALGTPDRNKVMITLLDKVISANLLYLDAKQKGTDRQTAYLDNIKDFEDAVLTTMYKDQVMIGDLPVSAEEVQAYYDANISKESELNADTKLAIESKIRKDKFKALNDSLRERLRSDTEVIVYEDVLGTKADAKRSAADIVARIGDKAVTWSDVEVPMRGADRHATLAEFYVDNEEERLERLQNYIDNVLMADKARAAGMDKTPEFVKRTAEYRKTRLITTHRDNLVKSWQPSEDELKTYYTENMSQIAVPERRKLQMVVVKTKEEAQRIKDEIDSGKITMFKAAQDYSIDPTAKTTLGDMGWVNHGTGFKELDDFAFSLEPEVLGGPVESPAGWHLVKVLDVIDAQYQYFDDPQAQHLALRQYMKDKYNDYVVDLRKNHFNVVVYDDELTRQFQKEADYIAELKKKSEEQDSITKQRVDDMQKWITPPLPPGE